MGTFGLACKYAEEKWPDGRERLIVGTVLWFLVNVTAVVLGVASFLQASDSARISERWGAVAICILALAGLVAWYLVLRVWSKRI